MPSIRFIYILGAIIVASLFWSLPVQASTNICGSITSNTTWTVAGSPYIATCAVQINATAVVTVEPGVTVKFNTTSHLRVFGKLTAVGTASEPITFTTNAATPTRGSWRGIHFEQGTSTSQLSYVNVSWGGVGGYNSSYDGLIVINTDPVPQLDHLTLSESSTNGIKVLNGWVAAIFDSTISNCTAKGAYVNTSLHLTNTTISNNGSNGIYVNSWAYAGLFDNVSLINNADYAIGTIKNGQITAFGPVTVTGNGGGLKDAIGYSGGTIDRLTTWDSEIEIVVLASTVIGTNYALTVNPGTTIKFNTTSHLEAKGKLTAVGNATEPITFTTNATTPTRGSWRGIYFEPGSSESQLSYVNVSWGGASGGTDRDTLIKINTNPAPTMDHITVTESSTNGIKLLEGWPSSISDSTISNCTSRGATVSGGDLNLTNTTISNNGSYGIYVDAWAFSNLTNVTISNNSDYAIGVYRSGQVRANSPITLTGNGNDTKNAIGHLGGIVSSISPIVWDSEIPIVVLNSPLVGGTSVLTINPGAIIRFASDKQIDVDGTLTAVGTPQQPILFTSNLTTPSPGSWRGLYFHSGSSASELKYATISYGGAVSGENQGIILLKGSSPSLTYLTITDSSTSAIRLMPTGTANPVIHHCSFMNNASGITNLNAATISAKLNYWNATNGPSGAGPGNGQSVSTNVQFDPFFTAAPVVPHLFSSATVLNQTFNPANGVNMSIPFETTLSGNWNATFKNAIGTILRTFGGTGQTGTVVWDGRDSSGTLMFDGTYNFEVQSTASSGEIAASVKGVAIVIDSTKLLGISTFTVSSAFFSPNNDGAQDTTIVQASFNFDDVNWTLNFRDSSNAIVRSTSGQGAAFNYVWDGKDSNAVVQPDGGFIVELLVVDGTMNGGSTKPTTIDNTFPVSQILYPNGGGLLSNFYQAGSMNVSVTANSSDLNYQNWSLERGSGAAPTSWTALTSGTSPVAGNSIYVWPTQNLTNGIHSLKFQTWDKAGNLSVHIASVTVGNFKVSMNTQQINMATSQTVTYTSTVPFPLTETIIIKNKTGQVVRTLVNGASRNAGTYPDVWNGKNDSGSHLPAGGYFYVATVTDGTNSLTWDLSNQLPDIWECTATGFPAWDPFNNKAFTMTATIAGPRKMTVGFSPTYSPGPNHGFIPGTCNYPNYCSVFEEYTQSGTHTYRWAGVDEMGALRDDMIGYALLHHGVENNAVVLYGTRPKITVPVTVSPALFHPHKGPQTLSFTVTSFQNQTVNLSATFINQTSLSPLRTIVMSGVSPGNVNVTWDGKGDNSMWVAPGGYTIVVQITDSIGNSITERALTTVRY